MSIVGSLNYGLRDVNYRLDNCELLCANIGAMDRFTDLSLASRLRETFGDDKPPTVAKRLTLAGCSVSYQAIYKWLRGGAISDDMLDAVAAVYRRNRSWLKYGEEQPDSISRVVQAMHRLPAEKQETIANFVESFISI